MPVSDYGIEVLKKAANEKVAGDKSAYYLDFSVEGTEFPTGTDRFKVKVSADGEIAVISAEAKEDVFIVFAVLAASSITYYSLVDLSDTTNLPHDETGSIRMSQISINVDKPSNTNASLLVGVITRVDGTDADVSYLTGLRFKSNGDTKVNLLSKYSPSQLKFKVVSGALTDAVTNITESAVTEVNTGLTLDSVLGDSTVTPAVGDIIIKYDYLSGGDADFEIIIAYHGEP